MTRKVKHVLIILGVVLEAVVCIVYGFALLPVPKPVCLLIWCLLSLIICRVAEVRTVQI